MLTFNHFNFNVSDLDASLKFYADALDLHEVRRKEAGDGSFTIVFLGDGQTDFRLELTALRDHLKKTPYGSRVRFDFSIINDMSYYGGVVFCGFLCGRKSGFIAFLIGTVAAAGQRSAQHKEQQCSREVFQQDFFHFGFLI